ncbi:hypothetical protein Hanom_Chr09g00865451 [Helianthus anomalus]
MARSKACQGGKWCNFENWPDKSKQTTGMKTAVNSIKYGSTELHIAQSLNQERKHKNKT